MAFTWAAVYSDGEIFHQYCPKTGTERSSEQIDRRRLRTFILRDHDGKVLVTQELDPGQRFIYRRRTEAQPGVQSVVVHLVGWQMTVGGENVQHIAYAFEADNRVVMAGKWREDHRWFYAVHPVPAESVLVE